MYQALYRKYRPKTFDEVVGQASVTQTLKAQLTSGKLSHAYLFTGSRGTGKTSCAKILAKAVNCEHPVSGNPCNSCPACRSIESGACMDVLEIDAASNNGVDNVRDLRDDAVFSPSEVKKRVYIIDEVHMLSTAAFNALLKIIEEPPEHLMFILATTELHKVPATILSRCQRFAFRRLLPEDIAARLNYAAYQEGIDLQPEAAVLLARLADGALRDGMSLLDQCATAGAGVVSADSVCQCLSLAGTQRAIALLTAAAEHDAQRALALFSEQYAAGKDVSAMLDELLCLCRDLLVLQTAPKGGDLLSGVGTVQELSALLPKFTAAELLRLTTLLQQTCAGFSRSANRRIDAELCLLQMCDPALALDAVSLNARISRLEEQLASGRFAPAPKPVAAPPMSGEPAPRENTAPAASAAEPERKKAPPETGEALPVGFWADLVNKIKPELKLSVRGFFSTGDKAQLSPELQGQTLLLHAENDWVRSMVNDEPTRQILAGGASALLGRPVTVRIDCGGDMGQGDPLQAVLEFGKQHEQIVKIKGE